MTKKLDHAKHFFSSKVAVWTQSREITNSGTVFHWSDFKSTENIVPNMYKKMKKIQIDQHTHVYDCGDGKGGTRYVCRKDGMAFEVVSKG